MNPNKAPFYRWQKWGLHADAYPQWSIGGSSGGGKETVCRLKQTSPLHTSHPATVADSCHVWSQSATYKQRANEKHANTKTANHQLTNRESISNLQTKSQSNTNTEKANQLHTNQESQSATYKHRQRQPASCKHKESQSANTELVRMLTTQSFRHLITQSNFLVNSFCLANVFRN